MRTTTPMDGPRYAKRRQPSSDDPSIAVPSAAGGRERESFARWLRSSWQTLVVARVQRQVPRLGELLIRHGAITPEQLEQALARQRVTGRRLGIELIDSGYVARRQLRRALLLQRLITWTAFATALALAATRGHDAHAGTSRAQLGVTTVVPPVAVLRVEHQAPELMITAADVARGYVDVPAASRLAIRTSSRAGYMLDFHSRVPLFRTVAVRSKSGQGTIGPEGGTLVARGDFGRAFVDDLSFRFHLDDDVGAGTYPWPLAVAVRPL